MMTQQYYEGYLAGYAGTAGRSSDPEWLSGYDKAEEDKERKVVNGDFYKRFHGEMPGAKS